MFEKGHKQTEEHKEKRRFTFFSNGHIPWNKGKSGLQKHTKRAREGMCVFWNNFYRMKVGRRKAKNHSEKMKGCIPWNKGLTKKTDERVKAYVEKSGQSRKGKTYLYMSKNAKRSWQNSEFVKKQMRARNVQPNKTELKLSSFLQQILSDEYKYVGNGEFILAGKCPDFININGQKKIIELFGDYWHKGDNGKKRIDLFKQYGYETLIVWENELEDENLLKEKLLDFNRI